MKRRENTRIGFIGTGVMGSSMAQHLMNAGYPVIVYNRTKEKAKQLLENGAKWADSPKEVTQNANVIITIVGTPTDVEETYLGENGIIPNAEENTYVIDMTTSKPSLAAKIYDEAKKKGIHALDAPVSGGDVGARNGSLSIMVGGDEKDFNEMLPIFQVMGENIVYQGKAGCGQHTKMCNQIAIAAGMISVCEAVVYAEKSGLDPDNVLKSISTGAAGSWSLSNYAPRMMNGNFDPGFAIKHFIKDMKIALEESEKMGIEMPGLELAFSLYNKLAEKGEGESGIHALYKYWEK